MAIITLDELSNINSLMLGRGAPVQRDNTGYNKPDYSICTHIYYGMSTHKQQTYVTDCEVY